MEEFLSDPTAILTCQAVERSNHLKKKARIVEGSRTRVEPGEAELSLKSAELVLCIVGLYHGYFWETHPKGKIDLHSG